MLLCVRLTVRQRYAQHTKHTKTGGAHHHERPVLLREHGARVARPLCRRAHDGVLWLCIFGWFVCGVGRLFVCLVLCCGCCDVMWRRSGEAAASGARCCCSHVAARVGVLLRAHQHEQLELSIFQAFILYY
jgi:hypothetical protein